LAPGGHFPGLSPRHHATKSPISVRDDNEVIRIVSENADITFSRSTGILDSCVKDGRRYLNRGPRECFSRPYSGVDACRDWGRDRIWRIFDEGNLTRRLRRLSALPIGNDRVQVESVREVTFRHTPHEIVVSARYEIGSEGMMKMVTTFEVDPSLGDLPRLGMEIIVAEGFEDLEYCGLGPHENYRDRRHSSKLGVFKSSIEKQHFPFIPPSENGGHEETRWLILSDHGRHAIRIDSAVPFHFDVHHNSIEDYMNANHEHELERRRESYLHIDAQHTGIGGEMGWSTVLDRESRTEAVNNSLVFTISWE
jgi:beta-galactosidase